MTCNCSENHPLTPSPIVEDSSEAQSHDGVAEGDEFAITPTIALEGFRITVVRVSVDLDHYLRADHSEIDVPDRRDVNLLPELDSQSRQPDFRNRLRTGTRPGRHRCNE